MRLDLDATSPGLSGTLIYLVDHDQVLDAGDFVVQLWLREEGARESYPRPFKLGRESILWLAPQDRHLCSLLADPNKDGQWKLYERLGDLPHEFVRTPAARDSVLPLMLATGRLYYQERRRLERPVPLDEGVGHPWRFVLRVSLEEDGAHWRVGGFLVRDRQELELDEPWLLMAGGWVIWGLHLTPLEDHGAFHWIDFLRRAGPLRAPKNQEQELVERLWKLPRRLPILWPEELKLKDLRFEPRPRLRI